MCMCSSFLLFTMWAMKEAQEILIQHSLAYYKNYGTAQVTFLNEVIAKIHATGPDNRDWGDLLQHVKWWFNTNASCHHIPATDKGGVNSSNQVCVGAMVE